MIKTILVPTDGSDHANKATTLAADIAEKYGARLVVLHVMSRGPLPEAWRHMAEVEHVVEPTASSMAGIPTANIPTTKGPSELAGGNRTRALQCATDNYTDNRVRHRCHDTAQREYEQTADNDRFATNTVRQHPERDLKERLSKSVGTDCQAHQ